MKLREITIRNFRCLANVSVKIGDMTVLVGENNAGKTALLDALACALPRNTGSRPIPFSEYDFHMVGADDSPHSCGPVTIELWFREDRADEWPSDLTDALDEIIQTDPDTGIDSIGLRVSCQCDEPGGSLRVSRDFLTSAGQTLERESRDARNYDRFTAYQKLFHLSALRDSSDEFSSRSQYWGRILRDLKIDDSQKQDLKSRPADLNRDLLAADPRLRQVVGSLDQVQTVLSVGEQRTAIQALPLKPWELMSRSEVVMKGLGGDVDFPLSRHGQGVQSLAVLFLFQAYIDVLMKPRSRPETEALLTLEEPEAHLHPQATRSLAANLELLTGQKIVSSHSPFFVQEVPLANIRMFRRVGAVAKVLSLNRSFEAEVPQTAELDEFCTDNQPKFRYVQSTKKLAVAGSITEEEYRKLVRLFSTDRTATKRLRRLKEESQLYISDDELDALYTYVKRVRGEILFARSWLLCEGPSEYLILRYFAQVLGSPLDQAGVSVIDFQNNGKATAFVALAASFEIPWVITCDGDGAGDGFIKGVKERAPKSIPVDERLFQLPKGSDLEQYLFSNGFADDYKCISEDGKFNPSDPQDVVVAQWWNKETNETSRVVLRRDRTSEVEVLAQGQVQRVLKSTDDGYGDAHRQIVIAQLHGDKVRYASALIRRLQEVGADANRVPSVIRDAIIKAIQVAG